MTLTKAQRESILAKVQSLVAEKYFDPSFNEAAWQEIVRRNRVVIIDAGDTPSFDAAIARMLSELSPRTLGLLSDHTPISPRSAINASFSVEPVGAELCWVFQDVLPGGVAARAGIQPGDILLSAAGKSIRPASKDAAEPSFECSEAFPLLQKASRS